jgi:hypothetical protein
MMLRTRKTRPEHIAALDRVREWTRERFRLPDDAAIMVSEVTCSLPGCPPLETVVAFWTEGDTRHHFKIFKRVAEVVPDDLPPPWLKDALIAVEGEGLECC